jgi:hypothetical protein
MTASKEYTRKYNMDRYYFRREMALSFFRGVCSVPDCKEQGNLFICALNPADNKSFTTTFSLAEDNFFEELNHFHLRCGFHIDEGRARQLKHGAYHAYYRAKCRCDDCCEWHSNYVIERAEVRREKRALRGPIKKVKREPIRRSYPKSAPLIKPAPVIPEATSAARLYSPKSLFVKNDLIRHSKFGIGIVTLVKSGGKFDVLFLDGQRVLIHGR